MGVFPRSLCGGDGVLGDLSSQKLVRLLVLYTLLFAPVSCSTADCGVFAEYILYIYTAHREICDSVSSSVHVVFLMRVVGHGFLRFYENRVDIVGLDVYEDAMIIIIYIVIYAQ